MSTRYFVHPGSGFADGTLYVYHDEATHITRSVSKDGTDCERQVQSGTWVELTMLDVDHLRLKHGLPLLFSAQVSPEAAAAPAAPRSDVPATVAEDAW